MFWLLLFYCLLGSLFWALAILLFAPVVPLISSIVLVIVAKGLDKLDVKIDEALLGFIAVYDKEVALNAPDKSFKLICYYYY